MSGATEPGAFFINNTLIELLVSAPYTFRENHKFCRIPQWLLTEHAQRLVLNQKIAMNDHLVSWQITLICCMVNVT